MPKMPVAAHGNRNEQNRTVAVWSQVRDQLPQSLASCSDHDNCFQSAARPPRTTLYWRVRHATRSEGSCPSKGSSNQNASKGAASGYKLALTANLIRTLAVESYRSIRQLVLPLE